MEEALLQYTKIENDDGGTTFTSSNENAATCLLEEHDLQCGHIFYNEDSRLLKFFCTFCRSTYDNINIFCEHLSSHISEELENTIKEEILSSAENENNEEQEQNCFVEGNVAAESFTGCDVIRKTKLNEKWSNEEAVEDEKFDDLELALTASEYAELDSNEMLVEELDDSDEIAAEVEHEMKLQSSYETGDRVFAEENSNTSNLFGYDENEFISENETSKEGYGDDGTCIDVNRSQSLINFDKETTLPQKEPIPLQSDLDDKLQKKKKKRVTTVKVIAVKNRIAELYDKIKHEEEKRSQLTEVDDGINNVSDENAIHNLSNQSSNDKENEKESSSKAVVERQIIGETLITHIPDADTGGSGGNRDGNNEQATNSSKFTNILPRRYHMNTNDKDRTCPACGKIFRSSFSLAIHKRSHYLESQSNIKLAHKCSDCDQLFNKIPELKEHVQKVHYPDGFICKICNKKLSRLSLLEMHMRKVHLARPFNCNICNKNFSNREIFDIHVNSHMDGKDYRCHICGRKYPTESVLQYHMKRHKEPIPQCCVVCGKMTLRITQHMKIHTPRPKRILSCSVCGKVFNFSSGLSHHFKIMHKQPRHSKLLKDSGTNSKSTSISTTSAGRRKRRISVIGGDHEKTEWTSEDMLGMDQKEEEAKRVIVELIQNASYTPYQFDNNQYDAPPPIAREETISAINSIVEEESDLDVK